MIPLSLAQKLHKLASGELMPASRLKHTITDELIAEGILAKRIVGRTKVWLFIPDATAFSNYLFTRWAITDLGLYIDTLVNTDATRAQLVAAAGNSKLLPKRSFQGFLINSYMPVGATLHGQSIIICPPPGTFHFIHDFAAFIPDPAAVIIGVENAENFAHANLLSYLFPGIAVLFVSRYPQSQGKDLIQWLSNLPNQYWHMGDYDFAGINIYMQEYKKYLGGRATFFIPPNIGTLLDKFGNAALYDTQQLHAFDCAEPGLQALIGLLHQSKKCLEQEALLLHNGGAE